MCNKIFILIVCLLMTSSVFGQKNSFEIKNLEKFINESRYFDGL